MTARRSTLGNRLARSIALSTFVCLVLFSAIGTVAWWAIEGDESQAERLDETPTYEFGEGMLLALSIAAPLGIATTVLAARWLTRRATARIDRVTELARRVDARDLTVQLPVGTEGDELDELAGAVNQMLARIEAGVAGQRQFAADASHELRTPLATLRATLEVTGSRPRSHDEWKRMADDALLEIDQMTALVDSLLQLARADASLTDGRGAIEIGDVVERACGSLATSASAAKVGFAVDVPDGLLVLGDADGLSIALRNLIANAITHSPAGSDVAVAARATDGEVQIQVRDHGPGVPATDRDRIFVPFARGRGTPADRVAAGAGVGLGLPIAKRIADAHGGRIDLADAPGGGAAFTLILPHAAPPP